MAWLAGYKYRKKITIDGSPDGAQTDYQMRLAVYKNTPPPSGFTHIATLEDKIIVNPKADGNHAEGVASDGTYLYASDRFNLYKLEKDGTPLDPEVKNDHAATDGTDCDQINHIWVQGDYLYVGASHLDSSDTNWIKVFNKSDLSYVEEHQVACHPAAGNNWGTEGCCYYKGYWWVVYFDWENIAKYNDAWEHQADYALTSGIVPQGIFVIGDYLVICHGTGADNAYLYRWEDPNLVYCGKLAVPTTERLQGGSKEPSADEVWWCDFVADETDGDIVHTTINYANDTVSLNGHCQDDFDDVRFTQADGETELDYWLETGSLKSGVSAAFWIEFNSIADGGGSPSYTEFYMYYGKEGASSTSSGADTFQEFDDFPGDTLDGDRWDDDGWAGYGGLHDYISVADSLLTITGDDANFLILVNKNSLNPATKFSVIYRLRDADTSGTNPHISMFDGTSGGEGYSNRIVIADKDLDSDFDYVTKIGGVAGDSDLGVSWLDGIWYRVEFRRHSTGKCSAHVLDDAHTELASDSDDDANWNVTMYLNFWKMFNIALNIDWLIKRNFTPNEPTWGTGGGEEATWKPFMEAESSPRPSVGFMPTMTKKSAGRNS